MSKKAQDFFDAFKAGQISRRELMAGAGKLGVTAATANLMLNAAGTRALAADFDWKKFNGGKLHLLLNKHPYADAMIADIANFKALTGMDVTYDIFPEDVYFDKVTAALSSKSRVSNCTVSQSQSQPSRRPTTFWPSACLPPPR